MDACEGSARVVIVCLECQTAWIHLISSSGCIVGDADERQAELGEYWKEYKLDAISEDVRTPTLVEPSTPAPDLSQSLRSQKRRSRALSDAAGFSARDHRLSPDHPALSMLDFLDTFGPLIFPLYKAALLRKRILLMGSVPIQRSCNFGAKDVLTWLISMLMASSV